MMDPPYYPQQHCAPLHNYASTFDPHEQHPPPLQLSIPPQPLPPQTLDHASYPQHHLHYHHQQHQHPHQHQQEQEQQHHQQHHPSQLPPTATPQRGRRRKAPETPTYAQPHDPNQFLRTPMNSSSVPFGTAGMTPIVPNPNVKPVREVQIRTKFPVARIKRIMQADEDVGKVAQVTPVIVSKALELFMIQLCDKASEQARLKSSKRITAAHLKRAVSIEEKFDFLAEIIAKVPDASAGVDGEGEEGQEEQPKKRRARGTGTGRGKAKVESD